MKRNILIASCLLAIFADVSRAASDQKIEIYCERPNHIYDLSIWIRNSFAQGGPFDGSLRIFLNGGYLGGRDISRFTNAFGKGDAITINLEERAWKDCKLSEDRSHLQCDVTAEEKPIQLVGQKDFQSGYSTFISASRFAIDFNRDPKTQIGHFRFDVTESETGISKTIEYDLLCPQ